MASQILANLSCCLAVIELTHHELIPCPVRHWASVAPDQQAIYTNPPLSYKQMDERLNSLVLQLHQGGLRRGDRLAAIVRGELEDVLLAWSCVRSGILFCPINPAFPLDKQIQLAAMLHVSGFWSATAHSVADWPRLELDFTTTLSALEAPLTLDPAQLTNVILTSGSSGTPKAVVHRLANHLASAAGSAMAIPLDSTCGWLLSLPLFHIGGYAILFRVFLAGATLVLDERQLPLKERLEQHPITH